MEIPKINCKNCRTLLATPKYPKGLPPVYRMKGFEAFGDKRRIFDSTENAVWGEHGWLVTLDCKSCGKHQKALIGEWIKN